MLSRKQLKRKTTRQVQRQLPPYIRGLARSVRASSLLTVRNLVFFSALITGQLQQMDFAVSVYEGQCLLQHAQVVAAQKITSKSQLSTMMLQMYQQVSAAFVSYICILRFQPEQLHQLPSEHAPNHASEAL